MGNLIFTYISTLYTNWIERKVVQLPVEVYPSDFWQTHLMLTNIIQVTLTIQHHDGQTLFNSLWLDHVSSSETVEEHYQYQYLGIYMMIFSHLSLIFSFWLKNWNWNWVCISQTSHAFPLRPNGDLLLPPLCLCWTMVMWFICRHPHNASTHRTRSTTEQLLLTTALPCLPLHSTIGTLFFTKLYLGLLPFDLQMHILQAGAQNYCLRSQDLFLLPVPKVRINLGKRPYKSQWAVKVTLMIS